MLKSTRRNFLTTVAGVAGLAAVGASPAHASPGDGASPAAWVPNRNFLEVNKAGELVSWSAQNSGPNWIRSVVGVGWGTARLISLYDHWSFLEVKTNGLLSAWYWENSAYQELNVGNGWENARLITGLRGQTGEFLEVKNNGLLSLWVYGRNGYQQTIVGSGWDNARLIAGLQRGSTQYGSDFLEIKQNGNLSLWRIEWSTKRLSELPIGVGWDNTRLIAGVNHDGDNTGIRFVELKNNGMMSEWGFDAYGYLIEYPRGSGWDNARLIG
ncbi:twin-arginine translocation signal domain-containing protein [Nonomuraea guangzhouensis]|uniref:Twin-arginine translocation signal domain-containing protein n=1 Tax=Nonomuraea guangzhouensis TaxID=1291555 RepID=A0ABW4GGS8_9ACTN|nr:twin-arginine translocation signal domain-containing protein [Nonomuraea guangzhouensis]